MKFARQITRFFYVHALKPALFLLDPESVHDHALLVGRACSALCFPLSVMKLLYEEKRPSLKQNICGINFENPFCISGGFDKDAYLTSVFPALGFGFMEIGSVTWNSYLGNAKPRLMRLPKSESLWINYGLKNQGAVKIHERVSQKKMKLPLFVNVAKTNCKETVDTACAIEDYRQTMSLFSDRADAFTVNISCPNAFGGQPFHNPDDLRKLLQVISTLNLRQPIFIKVSPDISFEVVDQLLKVVDEYKVDGFIISNLRKDRELSLLHPDERSLVPSHGGISGSYLRPKADTMLCYFAKKIKKGECKKYVLIGVGGVNSAQDAYRKIRSGAALVQLVTGMIFCGPQIAGDLCAELDDLIKKDGFKSITEAIGADI